MNTPLLSNLPSIVLASQSPRRKHLLETIGIQCSVQPSSIDEEAIHQLHLAPADYVQHLALEKARNVAQLPANQNSVVLGADTTVVLDGVILNKPTSTQHAFEMLSALSGHTHSVFTGFALVHGSKEFVGVQETKVRFRRLEESEILAYIATGSPMDKAGAYGIQEDLGAVFVEHIDGCYYTVVGLPLQSVYMALRTFI